MAQDRYALTYRAAEARQVTDWIKAGQSGCLIGLRGAGKSNFLRFLLRQDVQQHYLGQNHPDFIFVLVDLLALAERTAWAVYELMLDRLVGQLHLLGGDEKIIGEIASLQQEITRARDMLTAQRAFERGIDLLCRRLKKRIVLLLDEFDAVFQTLDAPLFRTLRAIRDTHKGQVSYIVIVTNDLAYLRDDLAEVEHFYRLVSRNVCGLGPYSETDARQMLRYLATQRSTEFTEQDAAYLVEQSGGHAGLLKSILSQFWDVLQECDLAEIAPLLQEEPVVQAECRKVWASISETEQAALNTLVAGGAIDPLTLKRLHRKGLIRESQTETLLFSPLFANFVRKQAPSFTKGILISRSPRWVRLDGQSIETLTELEFEMLCYLYERRGQVCTKDELIENVYRQQYDRKTGDLSDAMLQQLISRLRAKIEPNRRWPRYIVTVRGEGYRLITETQQQIGNKAN